MSEPNKETPVELEPGESGIVIGYGFQSVEITNCTVTRGILYPPDYWQGDGMHDLADLPDEERWLTFGEMLAVGALVCLAFWAVIYAFVRWVL